MLRHGCLGFRLGLVLISITGRAVVGVDEDCEKAIWEPGTCEDNATWTRRGIPCAKLKGICLEAAYLWQIPPQEIYQNCPLACNTCPPCRDNATFVSGATATCSDFAPGNCTPEAVVSCPKACGACSCWSGCYKPGIDDGLGNATENAYARNQAANTSIRMFKAHMFPDQILAALFVTFVRELLGIEIEAEIPKDTDPLNFGNQAEAYTAIAFSISDPIWAVAKRPSLQASSVGFNGKSGIYFAGLRDKDCNRSHSSRCVPCTPDDISAGRCPSSSDAYEYYPAHTTAEATRLFPAIGTYRDPNNTAVYRTPGAVDMALVVSRGIPALFIPPQCEDPAFNFTCMEMIGAFPTITNLEKLMIRAKLPYQLMLTTLPTLKYEVEVRLAQNRSAVFFALEPDPWLVKVGARSIGFPFEMSACGDKEEGFGMAVRCEDVQTPLHNIYPLSLLEEVPDVFWSLKHLFRVTEGHFAQLSSLHEDGGGSMRDMRQVACEWMRGHSDIVRSWLPNDCGQGEILLVSEDGNSARCCNGILMQLKGEGPRLCLPHCDPASQVQRLFDETCLPRCPEGRVVDEQGGNTTCKACPPGTLWTPIPDPLFTGVTSVCRCPAGTFRPSGTTECYDCPASTDPGQAGQSTCRCARGFYRVGSGRAGINETCTPCPDPLHTTLFLGVDRIEDCVCGAGSYAAPGPPDSPTSSNCSGGEGACGPVIDHVCKACGIGLDCPAGTMPPSQEAGKFVDILSESMREYSVYYCRSSLECPAGPLGTCARGRDGLACGKCMDNHLPTVNGECKLCTANSVLPLAAMACVFLACTTGVAFTARVQVMKRRVSHSSLLMVLAQSFGCLQVMSIFGLLSVTWQSPVKQVFESLGILGIDISIANIPCVVGKHDPVRSFLIQLLVYPMFAATLVAVMWVLNMFNIQRGRLEYFNANGVVLLMAFVSLSLAVLTPLECLPNPNGSSAMASQPGVVCWEGAHVWMVVFALIGILAYPVTISAVVVRATYLYPGRIGSFRGVAMLRQYYWLFGRFRPAVFFYGGLYLLRAILLSFVPVLFPAKHMRQCLAISTVLLAFTSSQIHLRPWRSKVANYADTLMNIGLLQVMMVGSFLTPSGGRYSSDDEDWLVGVVLCFAVLVIVMTSFFFLTWNLYRKFIPSRRYGAFICHHKGGGAAWARLFKVRFTSLSRSHVFLDVDTNLDLDAVLDLLRSSIQNLLVLGTSHTLSRMWCAGEIATAAANNIPITLVAADDYQAPDEAFFDSLLSLWTAEEVSMLNTAGISLEMIMQTYRQLQVPCYNKFTYPRFGDREEQNRVIASLSQHCQLLPPLEGVLCDEPCGRPEVLVVGQTNCAEAVSCCEVLSDLVRLHGEVPTATVRSLDNLKELRKGHEEAPAVIVVLTQGLTGDPVFMRIVLALQQKQPWCFITVLADPKFAFPTKSEYQAIARGGPDASGLGSEEHRLAAQAYKFLFQVTPLPLAPAGSISLLRQQARDICSRLVWLRSAVEQQQLQGSGGDGGADVKVQDPAILKRMGSLDQVTTRTELVEEYYDSEDSVEFMQKRNDAIDTFLKVQEQHDVTALLVPPAQLAP